MRDFILEATLLEVQRFSTAAPQFFRRCTKACNVMGFEIPEGSYAVFALYAAFMDSALFPEPEQFNPYRFIEENNDGQYVVKNYDFMIAFGAGTIQYSAVQRSTVQYSTI